MKTTREAPVGSCIPLSFHRAGRAASSSDRGTVSKICIIQTASCEHRNEISQRGCDISGFVSRRKGYASDQVSQ
jgi:hypothetical protein